MIWSLPGEIGLLGIPLSASSILNDVLSGVTGWIESGAALLVQGVGAAISSTTEPALGANFDAEFDLIARFAAMLVPIFVVGVAIEAIVKQDLGLLIRAILFRAPVALICSGLGIAAVRLGLDATDALSRSVIAISGSSASRFVSRLSNALTLSGDPTIPKGSFEVAFLAGLIAFVAFVLWIELALRGAAITVAMLFIPLALAGVVFPATAHWVRRLAETLFALVLSKFVIASVISLAASSISTPDGPSGLVVGVAMLLLATLSPFALLRLIPMVESGAIGHLDGLGQRGRHWGRAALNAAPLPSVPDEELLGTGAQGASEIPMHPGLALGGAAFEGEVARLSRSLEEGRGLGDRVPEASGQEDFDE